MNNTNDIQLTKSFIKAFNLKIYFHKNENGNYKMASHSYNYLPVDSFLSFFNLKSILPNLFVHDEKSINVINNLLENKLIISHDNGIVSKVNSVNILDEWNGDIEKYVIESGIVNNFNQLYVDIISNLKQIEDELEIESVNTKELLDI